MDKYGKIFEIFCRRRCFRDLVCKLDDTGGHIEGSPSLGALKYEVMREAQILATLFQKEVRFKFNDEKIVIHSSLIHEINSAFFEGEIKEKKERKIQLQNELKGRLKKIDEEIEDLERLAEYVR